jgi:hypothetical protein
VLVVAACSPSASTPGPTLLVAGKTDAPSTLASSPPIATSDPGPSPVIGPGKTNDPGATADPGRSIEPTTDPGPTAGPDAGTAIVPGVVDRSSIEVTATYRVTATITVATGALDVTTRIVARNDSGAGIDRLELNTIAARLGGIKIGAATVDDVPVKVTVEDQTLLVPLGGTLPDGASATVSVAYRATLRKGLTGSDWMFSRNGGSLTLYRWIPWVSTSLPFNRPNDGEPFVTQTSPQVDVELLSDAPLMLAAPAAHVDSYVAGNGNDWMFTVRNVRDVSIVLAPEFNVATRTVDGIPVRAYTLPGRLSATQLVQQAASAISAQADLLGVAYPWTTLTVVETRGGVGLESPGMIWVPDTIDTRNRTYAVYQGTALQWFYGLVGNDQRAEPFADEGPADLLARTTLGTLRGSRCPRVALDRAITGYSKNCYFEDVLVQGGAVLDDIRERMGSKAFWAAMAAYLNDNKYGIGGTYELLEALRAASKADLLPILRSRFPTLY